ncbi:three-Cys-motif partner protein TcmP [Microvirga sp. GCM10011540]|uniref:three-Cys-motif partner protein TcmP n=1 Tax=Microvirga sp. GCM10011540 TaxID=3317338 RepID=UPI0036236146
MAKVQEFFNEQKDQSEVKAKIVSKYFDAWCNVMLGNRRQYGRINKLAYIDLFAGPGRYDDGSKSTPIMVLENAIKNKELSELLVAMFNDKDEDNIKSLRNAIDELEGFSKLKNKPIILCSEIDKDAEEMFVSANMCPTFSFVDPFGYKDLSAKFITAIIKDWGCDCVFFFNYGRINAGISNPMVAKHMDALFGSKRAERMRDFVREKSSGEREVYILEELAGALKELGARYVLPFRFKKQDGSRTSHALVFVTKNIRGYEIMKDIMARESSTLDQGVPSFTYSPADAATPLLFSLARPLEALGDDLVRKFAGRTLTMKEVYDSHHVDTPYLPKNYKSALVELEAAGRIQADPPAKSRKAGTFADKTLVTFPKLAS